MSSITSSFPPLRERIDEYSQSRRWLKVSRARAFASHLCFSTAIVSVVLAVVFFLWYPAPYFTAVGAWSIIRVLIGVDLVLGPLLTLIIFKPGKRLLIVDVAFIAIFQISALIYGLTVLYQERPYYAVFAIDRIHVLAQKDIPADARDTYPWMRKPAIGPIMASARRPQSFEEKQKLLEETVFGNAPDIERRPAYWVPLPQDLEALQDRAWPLELLRGAGETAAALVDELAAGRDDDTSELGLYPIISTKTEAVAILDLATGELLQVVAVEPWALYSGRND